MHRGGRGGGKMPQFDELLRWCPKSFDQGCSSVSRRKFCWCFWMAQLSIDESNQSKPHRYKNLSWGLHLCIGQIEDSKSPLPPPNTHTHTGNPPGHLTFLKIIVQIPPYLSQNALQMPLPSPYTASFQALSVNAFSVTYPRRTAGRRLDNLGVRMREHFCIFEKFPRSTEIIYK